ncbi:MAG: hypothetical protein QW448_04015, partial [Thermofilaceae archaeon]
VDAGLSIPIGDEVLPSDERVRGEHIANYASTLSEKSHIFSRYIERGLNPSDLPKHFDEVKEAIKAAWSMVTTPSK